MCVHSHHPLALSLALLAGALGCSSSGRSDVAATSAPATAAPTPQPPAPPVKTAEPPAPAVMACKKFATLDMATPSRPPVTSTVKGARLPAGGVVKAKTPQLFSIEYYTRDEPKVDVACTVRQQLEADKWTIQSMSGTGIVTILAHKAKATIEVMVGPGSSDLITTAIVTPK